MISTLLLYFFVINSHIKNSNLITLTQVILFIFRIVSGITYYGISLASADLSGDLFRDFALISFMEVPANFAVIYFCDR